VRIDFAVKNVLLSIQFLTIIPVRVKGGISEKDLSGAVACFPVAGAAQGLLSAVVALLGSRLFTPEIAACLVLIALNAGNGGFHLDGLADTFDGLAVKSTGDAENDRKRRLAVMKDSTTGAIGAAALILDLLLTFSLLHALLLYALSSVRYVLIFLMPVFSKWLMVQALHRAAPARTEGLGSACISAAGTKEAVIATVITILICLGAAAVLQHTRYAEAAAALLLLLFGLLYGLGLLLVRFFSARFGGLTGDTLGALHEASDILYLMVACIWLQHST
jgi:adenosylcobinamide-GDP ribazoletransferase